MTPRETVTAFWVGSALVPISYRHRNATTITGLLARLAHDTGIELSPREMRDALDREGVVFGEDGRCDRTFASCWTDSARRTFATLIEAARVGGR